MKDLSLVVDEPVLASEVLKNIKHFIAQSIEGLFVNLLRFLMSIRRRA